MSTNKVKTSSAQKTTAPGATRPGDVAHSLPLDTLTQELKTNIIDGLGMSEAQARLQSQGANELQEAPRPTFLHMLLEQFKDVVIIILIVAAIISVLVGEAVDAIAIMAIVIMNAVIGVVQESKAENALRALKKLSAPSARVVRDGVPQSVPAREVVAGDVVLLEAGNYIPADMRLVEAVNLHIDEASLTGESVPVDKLASAVLPAAAPLGDRQNMAFMSTLVTYGRGKGIVTSTGMKTQIGLIAQMLQSYEKEETPLQKRLSELGATLSTLALAVCALVFVIGIVRDTDLGMLFSGSGNFLTNLQTYLGEFQKKVLELFMTAVSLAIAAVPEGLPAVVTITLALGMQRMVRRHVLMRKLRAVETLGSTTVICSDKTGTLTQNMMTVTSLYVGDQTINVTGTGYTPEGEFRVVTGAGYPPGDEFRVESRPVDAKSDEALRLLLLASALCNDAQLVKREESGWQMIGDSTEGALIVAAAKAGLTRDALNQAYPRLAEIPFDSERKRMTTIHEVRPGAELIGAHTLTSPYVAFVKGAPDIVVKLCSGFYDGQGVRPMTAEDSQCILDKNEEFAGEALRVLGMAYRPLDSVTSDAQTESNLIFLGLAGMIDGARPEVKTAVQLCRGAGIKAVMITGDYKSTATAIGKQLDFFTPGRETVTGAELDQLKDDELDAMVNEVDVYARVSPQHKVRIVDALKTRGHIVAMTGDGVNDAPALKRANIGVAMGITGTDVAKETADMVLTDDNFASIVAAVEEGRIIYSNIRKFVFYLLACNVAEILIILVAEIMGLPLPLRPIQLLWLNLLTDGLPALALALEKGDPDVMQRPPRPTSEPVINRVMWMGIGVQAVAGAVAVLVAFAYGLDRFGGLGDDRGLITAQTLAFVVLNCAELIVVYAFRSERYSAFSIGLFSNRVMVGATTLSFVLLLVVVYTPFLQRIFYTTGLALNLWLLMLPCMALPFIAAELTKVVLRRQAASRQADA